MRPFENLFSNYHRLVVFDTETTGLSFSRDEIIEFSAVALEQSEDGYQIVSEYDELISLSPGSFVPPQIQQLTGISTQDLLERGISKPRLCRDIAELIAGDTLLLAYNAHFDLSFLYYLLLRSGDPTILKGKDKLDLLTVYRDRHSYPHRLCNAIQVYHLEDQVVNSHRAIDDVKATVAIMEAMETEKNDLERYVNLFGYNPKYGIGGKAIASITYKPQPYSDHPPLYEL
jgi:DNA polymerase-3 subunit epsilon